MSISRKTVTIAAVAAALAAAGVAVASAIGGDDSETPVTGPNAEQAKAAALDMVGGGTVTEIELQDGDGAGVYEVEVLKDDGSQVEVQVGGGFQPLDTATDDDGSGEDESSESEF